MVPVKEAIESGAWLQFTSQYSEFRLRVLSFNKVNFAEVDDPHKVEMPGEGGIFWIMKIEVVNLSKAPISHHRMSRDISLVDQDGFRFPITEDHHLNNYSHYAQESGLHSFIFKDFLPKIKIVRATTFFLPDDDEAEYSLAMEDGTVREA